MKIAISASSHIPSQWAHSINTVKHAQGFSRLGHEVKIFTVEGWVESKMRLKIEDIYKWYGIQTLPIEFIQDDTLGYYREYPVFSKFVSLKERIPLFSNNNVFKKITKSMKDWGAMCCYSRSSCIALENIKNGVPTFLETHGIEPSKVKSILRIVKVCHSEYLLGVITIHQLIKEKLIAVGFPENKIFVLEDAADIASYEKLYGISKQDLRKKYNLASDRCVITYVGHLYKGRGVEDIVDAAKRCLDDIFLIVGGRPEDIKRIKKQSFSKNVFFLGHQEGSKIPEISYLSDILVMPYTRDTPTWRHMSPLKLFEYLASGNPIIATDLPAITRVLKNEVNGLLVSEKNSAEIVCAIERLKNDSSLKEGMYRANIELARNYSYKKRCEKILSLYN